MENLDERLKVALIVCAAVLVAALLSRQREETRIVVIPGLELRGIPLDPKGLER